MTVSETIRKSLIDAKTTSRDGTVVHASMNDVVVALTAALSDQVVVPKEPTDAQIISALEWSLEWMRVHKVDGLSPFKDYPPVKDTIKGM